MLTVGVVLFRRHQDVPEKQIAYASLTNADKQVKVVCWPNRKTETINTWRKNSLYILEEW